MPTESLHQLEVLGSPNDLEDFRADHEIWDVDPWRMLSDAHLREDTPREGRLVYRFGDDYKRPAPEIRTIAAKYPRLTFIHEGCDEFGQVGWRARYEYGECVASDRIDPLSLEWVEWQYDEE